MLYQVVVEKLQPVQFGEALRYGGRGEGWEDAPLRFTHRTAPGTRDSTATPNITLAVAAHSTRSAAKTNSCNTGT